MRGGLSIIPLLALLAGAPAPLFSADAPREAKGRPGPPVVDGRSGDACWTRAAAVRTTVSDSSGRKVGASVSFFATREKVFFLVEFESPVERRSSRLWHWSPELESYLPGSEREDSLALFFSAREDSAAWDVWVWRAARTDPSGLADDMAAFEEGSASGGPGRLCYRFDSGAPCWEGRYFFEFAGDIVPRFYQRAPSGGAADVRARGRWSSGRWAVEFERRLSTGSPDDFDFASQDRFFLRLFLVPPESAADLRGNRPIILKTKD